MEVQRQGQAVAAVEAAVAAVVIRSQCLARAVETVGTTYPVQLAHCKTCPAAAPEERAEAVAGRQHHRIITVLVARLAVAAEAVGLRSLERLAALAKASLL